MIAHGVTVTAVHRLMKDVFVEVAETEFAIDGQPPTVSRISVLTGVHRKDVRAILTARSTNAAGGRERVTVMTSVIGRWLADPETTHSNGMPRALPRQSAEGPSFEGLARAVSTDVRPRTVLDELVRQKIVRIDPETDLLHLDAEAFVGPADTQQKVHFFSQNVGDHIAAATENLLAEGGASPYMERAVYYNRLTPGSVDEIEASARAEGTELLVALNRMAYSRQRDDMDDAGATERFRFGVFFYRTPETPDAADADADAADTRHDAADARPKERDDDEAD